MSDLKGLIIAAGRGERISNLCPLKPLLEVNGRALVDRTIDSLLKAGLKELVVVTGYRGEQLEKHLEERTYPAGVKVSWVRNEDWQKENGLSVYRAKDLAGDKFILLMADHIIDPEIISRLKQQPIEEDGLILAVDYRIDHHPYVDLDDVTRVEVIDDRIVNIGKGLAVYNAFDTGIFYATSGLLEALKESQERAKNFTLSGGVRILAARGRARVMDIGNRFWLDVDDEKAFHQAEDYLKSHENPA